MDGQTIKGTLGKNIKFLRFRKAFSQADLAEKADISVIFLSNIERGVKFPKPEVMARIAKALETEVFELFKVDLVPDNNKEMVTRLSDDVYRNVNRALDQVFKQYLG